MNANLRRRVSGKILAAILVGLVNTCPAAQSADRVSIIVDTDLGIDDAFALGLVLSSHDFDDLLMASRQMYTAVIFNPVPGPPMGKQPRLSFRNWIKGTDTLRVQIDSLTNSYHRHLVVKGLTQDTWREGAVDLTQSRRPDGTGGPLSANEQIDDIQFYADPNAGVAELQRRLPDVEIVQ